MAVSQFGAERTYYCLSTDDKPIVGVRNGDKLFEIDTSSGYRFNQDGAEWVLMLNASVTSNDVVNIVKLTQAEYDALPVVQDDTMYIISEV